MHHSMHLLDSQDSIVDSLLQYTTVDTHTPQQSHTVVDTERGLLKLNLRPRDTDTVDTDTADTDMVDTVDTIRGELLKTPLKLPSGSSHSNSFNLATIPSIF